jgi:glycosyltransferase involved in cell wall biosynthesis
MKKVLHLTLYLDIGGLERMILILCRGQKAAGWEPGVVVYDKATAELLPQFNREGVPVTFYPKGAGFSFGLLFRILRHMRETKVTLLHSHDLGALIYASLVRLLSLGRVQVVHTQHSFQHLNSRKARLYERIFPWLAQKVVCVSEDLRRTYLSLGQPLDRLRIVPNGVDFSMPLPTESERRKLRERLLREHGLPEALATKPWVITLGRLARVKGPERALELWIRARVGDAQFFMVGPETDPGMLAKLKSRAGANVHFPGPSLESRAWLDAADLFLTASEFEGLPLAGLEAAAASRPMLVSNIPGHSLFRGWAAYFQLDNPSDGALALSHFLENGELGPNTHAATALERLERGCGARKMTERYLKVYGELS